MRLAPVSPRPASCTRPAGRRRCPGPGYPPDRRPAALLAALLSLLGPGGCLRSGFEPSSPGPPPAGERGGPDGGDADRPAGADADAASGPDIRLAGPYQSCEQDRCAPGIDCIPGTSAFCLERCAVVSDCLAPEICGSVSRKALYQHCLRPCSSDLPCPEGQHCAGYGPYPGDHCSPLPPARIGELCVSDLGCPAGARCVFGYADTGRCTAVCPDKVCPADHLCFDVLWEGVQACLRNCAPLEAAASCASHEVCYPNPELRKAYCINAVGDPSTCNTTGKICVSGKTCVTGNICTPLCDSSHPCPAPQVCTSLNYGGSNLPWSACGSGP